MSAQTGIEWCDSTWNPWIGCTRVSPACDDCYAARSTPARAGKIEWGAGKPRRRTSVANWKLPERWNRVQHHECGGCGLRGEIIGIYYPGAPAGVCKTCKALAVRVTRRRVFCASLADWLDNEAPIEWLVDLLDLIRRTPNLDWLMLSKRIGNWRKRIGEALNASNSIELREWLALWLRGDAPVNVWLGATVINQAEADRDVPKLLQVPACVRFLSIEPMLGPVDLTRISLGTSRFEPEPDSGWDGVDNIAWTIDALKGAKSLNWRGLDWVICGGESGPRARPMHPDWVRSLRDQCAAAGVPLLLKQWGEWADAAAASLPDRAGELKARVIRMDGSEPTSIGPEDTDWVFLQRYGKKAAGRLLDGIEHNGFPL